MIEINKIALSKKEQNILQILNEFIRGGEFSSYMLTSSAGFSPATIGRILGELLENNLIVPSGVERIDIGRRPKLYKLNDDYGCLMHFTLTQNRISCRLANLGGRLLAEDFCHFSDGATLNDIFSTITILKERLLISHSARGCGRLLAAGFSLPGVVSEAGRKIYELVDIPTLNGVSFYDYTEKILNVPVMVNNTSWNAVLGERSANYSFADNLAYLNVTDSKGVGVGLILNGELIRGCNNYAGEVGLSFYDKNGTFDEYILGKHHIEDSASFNALRTELREEMERGGASGFKSIISGRDNSRFTVKDIEQAVLNGDEDAKRILVNNLKILAMIAVNINYLVNPDFIVLGGAFTDENKLSLQILNDYTSHLGYFKPVLRLSALGSLSEVYGGIHELRKYVFNSVILSEAISRKEFALDSEAVPVR